MQAHNIHATYYVFHFLVLNIYHIYQRKFIFSYKGKSMANGSVANGKAKSATPAKNPIGEHFQSAQES